MELDARKLQILRAVIDEYILSAAPVGSRSVSKMAGLNLSSATIRNEMADLEELGYLEQPHTSAGRVPSDKAYRLYVNSMLHRSGLSNDEIGVIRGYFSRSASEIESLLQQAAAALSEATQYTAFVLKPELEFNRLRHIQMVPLTEGRALLIVVTDAGFTKDCIVNIPKHYRADQLEQISHLMTERLYGCRMDQVAEAIRTELREELMHRMDFLSEVVTSIERTLVPDHNSVELSGTTKMLHYPEYSDVSKAISFLSAVEGKGNLYGLLRKANRVEFSFTIGAENELEPLQNCSIVTATYRIGDSPVGSLGVIGPTRMNYGKVVSVLEYMRKSLGEILSNQIEEE